jgi:hypothetical protein
MIRVDDEELRSRNPVDGLNCLEAAARYARPGRTTNSDFLTTARPTQPRRIEMHEPTDTDLDQFLAENPPWSGLACLERRPMPTRVTRHASTMSGLLTSARTDRSLTVKDANTNPVVPGNGRLV